VIGKTLAHYKILELLGEGGMGQVYLAEDQKLGRRVALKVLPPELAADDSRLRRLEREAKAIAALNHPNIVTLYSVEEDDGHYFLTMEYVEGETLGDMIARGNVSLHRFFEIATSLADALYTAHQRNVIHRDLKPANILLTKEGRPKILDFGLAKLRQPEAAGEDSPQLGMTLTLEGHVLGTVPYMSPEQVQGKKLDHRTDIFSLGVILYELATGRRPFSGDTSADVISSILRDSPRPIGELRVNLPFHLGRIIKRTLEKDPDRRYQTALDLRNELEDLRREIETGETLVSEIRERPPQPPAHAKRWPVWTGAAAALLILAGIVAWMVVKKGMAGPPPPARNGPALVLMPVRTIGQDTPDDFAAGLTEELASRFTGIGGLAIINRQTADLYEDSSKEGSSLRDTTGGDYLLEGTVRWRDDGESSDVKAARATFQLVRTIDDTSVWSESYDRTVEDSLKTQEGIAREVARTVTLKLLGHVPESLIGPPEEAQTPETEVAATPEPEQASETAAPAPRPKKARREPKQRQAEPSASSAAKSPQTPAKEATSAETSPSLSPDQADLAIHFQSDISAGILTIYADENQILRRSFDFGERKGLLRRVFRSGSSGSGRIDATREVPRSVSALRVYVVPDGEKALVAQVEAKWTEQRSGTLDIKVSRKGDLDVHFLPNDGS
jgi:TolB-like protein/predicted Ser/Thr protein kinase